MAEVIYGQGFELYRGLEEIRAFPQIFVWQWFWLFFLFCLLSSCGWKCYIFNVSRKRTSKIKYGLGSTTLLLQLLIIPIRD